MTEVVCHQDRSINIIQWYMFAEFCRLYHPDITASREPVCTCKTGAMINDGAVPAHFHCRS